MKKIALLFILVISLILSSCQGLAPTPTNTPTQAPDSPAKKILDGKKVAFLGCSYTFRTYAVNSAMGITSKEFKDRNHDEELFYQLCKENGAEVNVLDWTFSNHNLSNLFDQNPCKQCGRDHVADLTDRYYDYVVILEIYEFSKAKDYLKKTEEVMQFFREANPDVQFLYVLHDGTYVRPYGNPWRESIPMIEKAGARIIDWATLIYDIWTGLVEVPGAKQEYRKESFIVSKSPSDGYHPNPLVGYLYSLMVYCAITGEKAVGQPYAFATQKYGNMEKWENYKKTHYTYDDSSTEFNEKKSNFIDILSSAEDIKGLQTLVDTYLNMPSKAASSYKVRFLNDDGSLIEEKEFYYGKDVECDDPKKPGDNSGEYEFAGWDRPLEPCLGPAEYTAVYRKK